MLSKNSRFILGAVAASLLSFGVHRDAAAAGNTDTKAANAVIKIRKNIVLTKTADLVFADAYQGDATQTVLPADANAAAFNVNGEASTAYTITLPSSINMTTGAGATADDIIAVDSFASNPATSGLLNATGSQAVKVGARRAAIRTTQTFGNYTGTFNVTVAY